MECPSCYDFYNEKDKIPRNLPCGHTFCEFCIKQFLALPRNNRKCPVCRKMLDPSLKISQFSKNYVALEIASKHHEIRSRFKFCATHRKEPLRFYCENCEEHVCSLCIVEHSGHKFVTQTFSLELVLEKAKEMEKKWSMKQEEISKMKEGNEKLIAILSEKKTARVKDIDEKFDEMLALLEKRRDDMKLGFSQKCDIEIAKVRSAFDSQKKTVEKLDSVVKNVSKILGQISQSKAVKDEQILKSLESLEEIGQKDLKGCIQTAGGASDLMTEVLPSVFFDQEHKKTISSYGKIGTILTILNNWEPKQKV